MSTSEGDDEFLRIFLHLLEDKFLLQFSGRGKYFFANGDRYEGEFENGERDGFGIIFYASGGRRSGVWSLDKLVGEVRLYRLDDMIINGSQQFGNFSKSKFLHGPCRLSFLETAKPSTFFLELLCRVLPLNWIRQQTHLSSFLRSSTTNLMERC